MNGFYNILKPTGMTSSDVVVIVRGILRASLKDKLPKVGHMGTLDPGGSGVLPIAVGKATKLFDYTKNDNKIYRAGFRFGKETDTLDSYGKVIKTSDKKPTISEILNILPKLTGEINQIPPIYSSISIKGVRCYDMARNGENIKLKGRNVNIFDIKFIEQKNDIFIFDIYCSSGTYVRSIVRDMAYNLGTVGYMTHIIRLKSGNFSIENSITLNELQNNIKNCLTPLDYFTKKFLRYNINDKYEIKLINGVPLKLKNLPSGYFSVYLKGQLFGIGTEENGILRIKTRLM